ncbi:MAG: Mpo1-like protein [Rhizomicrobium sp.]
MKEHSASFKAFWPRYLREHANPQTRRLHYLGTGLATAALLGCLASRRFRLIPIVLVAGYGPAWIGHFFFERNKPATFTHPFWSLVSDYRMAWAWLTGRLGRELAKAGVRESLTGN